MVIFYSMLGVISSIAYLHESIFSKDFSIKRHKNGYLCAAIWSAFWSITILAVGYSDPFGVVIQEMTK